MQKKTLHHNLILVSILCTSLIIGGCGAIDQSTESISAEASVKNVTPKPAPEPELGTKGSRDNTPECLVPEAPGILTYGNELVSIDASNASDGYICVEYLGSIPKVKLQISCPNTVTYTYMLHGGMEVFPLTIDSGIYNIAVYENIADTQYSTAFKQDITIDQIDQYGPYLYPNQYVNFTSNDDCVTYGANLAYSANTDLDVVTNVYNYMVEHITYDTELAQTVQSGYTPLPDNTLHSGCGICLDYASLMAAMLRSQKIPTHMEVGYAGTAYHAWISVYLKESGWVNGIIEFNGTSWELMDPTFAASASEQTLKEFIGDGSNYDTKYVY